MDYSAEFGTKEEIRCQEGFVDLVSALYVCIAPCSYSKKFKCVNYGTLLFETILGSNEMTMDQIKFLSTPRLRAILAILSKNKNPQTSLINLVTQHSDYFLTHRDELVRIYAFSVICCHAVNAENSVNIWKYEIVDEYGDNHALCILLFSFSEIVDNCFSLLRLNLPRFCFNLLGPESLYKESLSLFYRNPENWTIFDEFTGMTVLRPLWSEFSLLCVSTLCECIQFGYNSKIMPNTDGKLNSSDSTLDPIQEKTPICSTELSSSVSSSK